MAIFRQPWSGEVILLFAIAAALPAAARSKDARSEAAADFKPYIETIPGSKVQFEMMPIPAGTFVMGSPPGETGRAPDEGPQHPVAIQAFWMGKTEVTWDEYDRYWIAEGSGKKPEDDDEPANADAISRPTAAYADATFGLGHDKHPVISITQHAAMEYCRWLSQKTGKIYRLPTEAEWEYAARAGTKSQYFFGDDTKQLGEFAWYAANYEDDDHKGTHEVGTKKPNPWGLYDMYGNVAEWCLDHYDKDFYAKFPSDRLTLEPVFLPTADRFPHVVRGGSWADDPPRLRSAARRGSDKSWIRQDPQRPQSIWWLTDADFVGFRIVRPVIEQEKLRGLHSKVTRDSK